MLDGVLSSGIHVGLMYIFSDVYSSVCLSGKELSVICYWAYSVALAWWFLCGCFSEQEHFQWLVTSFSVGMFVKFMECSIFLIVR